MSDIEKNRDRSLTAETGLQIMLAILLFLGDHGWNDSMVRSFAGANAIGMVVDQYKVAASVV
jgi:hypothetical protein